MTACICAPDHIDVPAGGWDKVEYLRIGVKRQWVSTKAFQACLSSGVDRRFFFESQLVR